MQLGRHSRIDYASPSLLQRHRNRCPCACSRGFARCRGGARVTTSFRLPNIANSNLEASPKFSRFWFEGFASVETSPIFCCVKASPHVSRFYHFHILDWRLRGFVQSLSPVARMQHCTSDARIERWKIKTKFAKPMKLETRKNQYTQMRNTWD